MTRWAQLTVLVVIAALLANGQCYARCLASTPSQTTFSQTIPEAHSGCHHSEGSEHNDHPTRCNDQHQSEAASAEARVELAKVAAVHFSPLTLPLSIGSELGLRHYWLDAGNLPERFPHNKPLHLTLSILRV